MHIIKHFLKVGIELLVDCLLLLPKEIFTKKNYSIIKIYIYSIKGYIFGYPLVLMDLLKEKMTSTEEIDPPYAPINQFAHVKKFPDDTTKNIIVSPNVDTLYSLAWLDLKDEPIILSVPEVPAEGYYLMPLLDAWTNVFCSVGTRTTGNGVGHFIILGPKWQGILPKNLIPIISPTHTVWLIGRIWVDNLAYLSEIQTIQEQFKLTPLSAWGKDDAPLKTSANYSAIKKSLNPYKQIKDMDCVEFFNRLSQLMILNPPAPRDKKMLKQLEKLGIWPGKNNLSSAPPLFLKMVDQGIKKARSLIQYIVYTIQKKTLGGWTFNHSIGNYQTNYPYRTMVAIMGLGGNTLQDSLYFWAQSDSKKHILNGANRYLLHFRAKQLPPVKKFWSITMYNSEHYLVKNPIHRFALGTRDSLIFNPDGSLDIYIQHEPPSDEHQHHNWLPAPPPPHDFNLILRLYWPHENISQWDPPSIKKII